MGGTEYPRAQLIAIPNKDKQVDENEASKDKDPNSPQEEGGENSAANTKSDGPMLDKNGNWVDHLELSNYISKTFESFALEIVSNIKQKHKRVSDRYDEVTYYTIYGRKKKQDFPCPKCDKVWDESLDLMGHLVIHFPGPDVVPDTFESCEAKIKANLEDDHRKYCKQMKKRKGPTGKEFRHRDKYARDKEGKFSRAPLQCPKCDALEKDAYEFKKHMLKHWNHYSIKCKNKDEKISLNVKKPSVKLSIKNTNGGYSSQITKDKAKLSCQGCERRFYTKKP